MTTDEPLYRHYSSFTGVVQSLLLQRIQQASIFRKKKNVVRYYPDAPGGLLYRSIWEVVLGNSLQRAERTFL